MHNNADIDISFCGFLQVNQTVKALKSNNICVGERIYSATFVSGKQITDAEEGKETNHLSTVINSIFVK